MDCLFLCPIQSDVFDLNSLGYLNDYLLQYQPSRMLRFTTEALLVVA